MAIQDLSRVQLPKTAIQQIGELLSATQQQTSAQEDKRQKDTMDQVNLYKTLREQGYSPEDATAKVNRAYRSTGFIENLAGGNKGGDFSQPTGIDKTSLENQKTQAEIAAKKAEVPLTNAKTEYYKNGGPRRSVIDKMTPNQLQSRLKYLQSVQGTMDTPEDNQNIDNEIKYVNEKIQGIAGFKPNEDASSTASKMVVMTGPDGKKYRIPAGNVEKAKARGFK